MAAQKLNGAVVAQQIKDETIEELARLKAEGITPGLAVVLVGNDPASQVYVNSKVRTCAQLGIYSQKHELSADISTETLLELVESLNRDDRLDGILVQSPLPKQVDTQRILDAVDPEKDVDGFHPVNVGRLMMGQDGLQPCTPAGIIQLLVRSGIEIAGKEAVVIGRSDIVGKPMSLLLLHRNATVTICHSRTIDLATHARQADILVAAIGRAAFVTPDFVKPGAVVVDVGVNRVESSQLVETLFSGAELDTRLGDLAKKGYTLIGDVDPRVAEVAGWLTPVPGGVGPLTISMLMKNTVQAAKRRRL